MGSVLLHAALLAFVVLQGERLWRRTPTPGAASIFALQGGGGGGGGNRVTYITLPPIPKSSAPPTMPAVPPPVALVEPEAPVPEPVSPPEVLPQEPPPDTLQLAAAAAPAAPPAAAGAPSEGAGPGTGGGTGGASGSGVGPGEGSGVGPGSGRGAGEGGAIRPPELRDLAFPFDNPPKELRGASLDVTFWVRMDGRVERYRVQPQITDRGYARKFDEVIRAFRFTPARAPDGSRIAGTTTVTFTLPGKRSS